MYLLAVLSHLRPRFAYTTPLEITRMRGAKAGVSPPAAVKPPYAVCNNRDTKYVYLRITFSEVETVFLYIPGTYTAKKARRNMWYYITSTGI